MSRKEIIDKIFYGVGKQNPALEVAHSNKSEEGKIIWSKWKPYLEAQADEKFMEKVNNRTILPFEVVIDLEDPSIFEGILKEIKQVFEFYSAYKTGSKGYHIHLFFNEELTASEKLIIIKRYKGDEQKNSDRCMIALENCPHWKTGNLKELVEENIGYNKIDRTEDLERQELLLDGKERSMSDLSRDVSDIFKDKNILFFKPHTKQIIEIDKIKFKDDQEDYLIEFREMSKARFITYIEKYVRVGKNEEKSGNQFVVKSLNSEKASIILASEHLENALPKIERIFPAPIPIILDGKLTFAKKGYDERFNSWRDPNSPDINEEMDLEEAKKVIDKAYKEFCFKGDQDKINAIAGLLTPFLRGLYGNFSTRTPIIFYKGNRERVGKDYCAGITGIVYDGRAKFDTPLSSGDGKGNNNEELRKKITAVMKSGQNRMHFANNKGKINNAVLEGLLTSEMWSDRALGKNQYLSFPNEMDYSLSGNVGISYTADFSNRSLFVNLHLAMEYANLREFKNPELHEWVKENRSLILSALFSLVKNWFDNGRPKGSVAFASYPKWANICGGIMECAGYGSPCKVDEEDLSLSGDSETSDMKLLFEACYELHPSSVLGKKDIVKIIENDGEIFPYFDFEKRTHQTSFGRKLISLCFSSPTFSKTYSRL